MTKCYLDSNIIIYLTDEKSLKYKECKNLIRRLISQNIELIVSPLCLDEFLHEIGKNILKLSGQKNYFEKLDEALDSFLELPNLFIVSTPSGIDHQKKIVKLMEQHNLRPRDAYHLLTMQANQIDAFATFDNDFHKVFQAKLLIKA